MRQGLWGDCKSSGGSSTVERSTSAMAWPGLPQRLSKRSARTPSIESKRRLVNSSPRPTTVPCRAGLAVRASAKRSAARCASSRAAISRCWRDTRSTPHSLRGQVARLAFHVVHEDVQEQGPTQRASPELQPRRVQEDYRQRRCAVQVQEVRLDDDSPREHVVALRLGRAS